MPRSELKSLLGLPEDDSMEMDTESKFKDLKMKEIDQKEKAMGDLFPNDYDPEGGIKDLEDALMAIGPMFKVKIQPFADTGRVSPEAASFVVTINEALASAGLDDLDLDNTDTDTGLSMLATEINDAANDRKFVRWLSMEAKSKPAPMEMA